ncbi:MAG TPA: SHOCT domain-containing protein [Pseudonocardiaceae bacterium]
MYWYGNGMSGWGYGLMGVTTALFAALAIVGIVVLVRYLSRTARPTDGQPPNDPEQMLAQRYARGELDDNEYQHRIAVLRGDSHAPRS